MKRNKDAIIVAVRDFSETPGPRSRALGEFSGEEFREKMLEPAFKRALEDRIGLVVDLDGTMGYSTAFIDGAIGELSRQYVRDGGAPNEFEAMVKIKSDTRPWYVDISRQYIEAGRKELAS